MIAGKSCLLILMALIELARFDLIERTCGYGRIHRGLRRTPARPRRRADIEPAVSHAMRWASSLYCRRVRCLQRSVVTTRLLRRYGVPASLVIGYRPAPFFSHAWVEVDGRTVDDSPEYARRLAILERV